MEYHKPNFGWTRAWTFEERLKDGGVADTLRFDRQRYRIKPT